MKEPRHCCWEVSARLTPGGENEKKYYVGLELEVFVFLYG